MCEFFSHTYIDKWIYCDIINIKKDRESLDGYPISDSKKELTTWRRLVLFVYGKTKANNSDD